MSPKAAWGQEKQEGQEKQAKPARWAEAGTGSIFVGGSWGVQADTGDGDSAADAYQSSLAYGFGLGVRAGYTFSFKLYLGARVAHHFGRDGWEVYYAGQGGSISDGIHTIGNEGGVITDSQQTTQFGTEVGFDFVAGPIVIRPYLADGLLVHMDEECFPGSCESFNTNELFLGIGASVFGVVGPLLIGLDSTFIAPLDEPSLNAGLFSLIVGFQLPQ
ncbi:MAG TPA: hypothetical protein VJU61_06600 [Polyangiaceae bacterium]|nr:hypothetical protein [Polyangiaceae bacterium]